MATKTVKSLDAAIALLIKHRKIESQAEAARQFGIEKPYFNRLALGIKTNPSDDILHQMGIERQVITKYIVNL
jgi:predicted XRE-type DNA-binding protein